VKLGTSEKVRKGVISLAIARPISAMGGLFLLVVLSRFLPVEEYGVYFAVLAIIELAILFSDFGVSSVIFRSIKSEIYTTGLVVPLGPLPKIVLIRGVSVVFGFLAIFYVMPKFSKAFGLQAYDWVFFYAAIIFTFEFIARTVEACFDSMLCQARAQFTLVLRTLLRLVGVLALLLLKQDFALVDVLVVEITATSLGALIALASIGYSALSRRGIDLSSADWSFTQVKLYAVPAYLGMVVAAMLGADMIKIILGSSSGVEQLAVYGFSFSIAAVIQRYLPANLMAGLFRPIFVSAASKPDSEKLVINIFVAFVKINWAVVLPLLVAFIVFGDEFFKLVAGGKYPDAASIFIVIVFGVMFFSLHLVLGQLCIAKKEPWISFKASLTIVPLIVLVWFMTKSYGAIGAAISFLFMEVCWCVSCFPRVFNVGSFCRYADIRGVFSLLLFGALMSAVAWILDRLAVNNVFIFSILLIAFLVSLRFVSFISRAEIDLAASIFPSLTKILNKFPCH
jgi:O-antigen/teichoic acid export membrane protein